MRLPENFPEHPLLLLLLLELVPGVRRGRLPRAPRFQGARFIVDALREPVDGPFHARVQCTIAFLRVSDDGTDGHVVPVSLISVQIQSFRHFVWFCTVLEVLLVRQCRTNNSLACP